MATSISSVNTDMSGLAATFQTDIKNIMDAESQPMKRVQTQKDDLNVRKGIYTDMKTNLDALQTALHALMSGQATYSLNAVGKPTVTPGTTGATVLTATTKDTAAIADYSIHVTQLAQAQSKASTVFSSADIALGKTGTFWMGGNGAADVELDQPSNTVTAVSLSSVASGQRELGSGKYSVQMRVSDGVRQFRIINADGQAVSVRNASGSGYSSEWQTMTGGSFNTGRGFSIALDTSGTSGSTDITYTAKGTSISISSTSTLKTIAVAINSASQPEGHDFKASVVGNQLVLTAAQKGANHGMIYTDIALDGTGLGFGRYQDDQAGMPKAQDARFTVNGVSVSRPSNTGLTDVVDGATINLAPDAEGNTALLSVGADYSKATAAVQTLVSSFNTSFKYLTDKMAVTSSTKGNTTTYTRGALAGDTVFQSLRVDLLDRMNRRYDNSGSMRYLSDIGISFDKDLKLTVDSTKFADTLKNHPDDVKALLDKSLGQLDQVLSSYTGSSGSLHNTMSSMDDQLKSYDRRIQSYQDNLNMRQAALIQQYTQMQTMLSDLGNQAQMFGINLNTSA